MEGYYTRLLAFLDHTVDHKFVEHEHRNMIVIDDNPVQLIEKFKEYKPPKSDKARWAIKMTKGVT